MDSDKQNIGQYIANILKEKELTKNSVVKKFFTTAAEGKDYNITFYEKPLFTGKGKVSNERKGKTTLSVV